MNKKNIVDTIMKKKLDGYGFKIDEDNSDINYWAFSRERNGVVQRISVQKHRYSEELFLNLATTSWVGKEIRLGRDIPIGVNYKHEGGNWKYSTPSEFKEILVIFLELIEKFGLGVLDKMCMEPDIIPTDEMGKELISSAKELHKKFINRYQIDNLVVTSSNALEWLSMIEDDFVASYDLPYDSVKPMLLEIVAFFSEQLRLKFNGEWKVGNQERIVKLWFEEPRTMNISPLRLIVESWEQKDFKGYQRKYMSYLYYLDADN